MYILRFTGFCLDIAMLESTKTISWALMPGIASHLLINDGLFIKNTSSRFWPLLKTSNQYRKEISEFFLALEEDLGLIQSVNFPTRGQNLLDVFFINRPSLINRCEAIPGISDHEIVFVDSNIAISRQKPVKRKIYMWKKADTQKLKS
jgi:hypothetical protein